ncbi:MAG: PAS domain S-box protein [Phormidesmis sp.]
MVSVTKGMTPDSVFIGGGEMGSLMRAYDWTASPLGPVDTWPQSLRTMVGVMLASHHHMFVMWGPQLTFLYNDGYRSTLGIKHPQALGQSGREVWVEAWDTLGPMVQQVMSQGEAAGTDNLQLFIQREDGPQECYFGFCYSPIRDETGQVAGLFCTCNETTRQVVGDRRLHTLRSLDGIMTPIKTMSEAGRIALDVLVGNPHDVPFALLYLLDGDLARLVSAAGISPDTAASPIIVDLTEAEIGWKFAEVRGRQQKIVVNDLAERFRDLPLNVWDFELTTAVVRPLKQPESDQVMGFLVMGVSPVQQFDDEYQGFFDLVVAHVEKTIIDAKAHSSERDRLAELIKRDRVLQESRQQLELALKAGGIGTWELALATPKLTTSDQCKLNYGLPIDADFTHSVLIARIHPDDRDWVQAEIQQTIATGNPYDVEYRTVWDDGSTHWAIARAYLVSTEAGEPERLVGISIDITSRKRSEEAIRASESRFRRMVESGIFGVVLGNTDGRLHYGNGYFCSLVGYSSDEIAAGQLRWDQLTPPEFSLLDTKAIEQLNAEGICTPYEKVFLHKNGRRIPVLITAAMLQGSYDGPQETIGILLDLTDINRVMVERDRFFDLSPDIFSIANLQGYFTYASVAWEKITGFTAAEITSRPYLELVHPDDREATVEVAQNLSAGIALIYFENRYRCKDGSYRWISWNVTTMPDENRLYCIGRDVSDRKRIELEKEELLQREQSAREAAERANRIKDEFLAVVSHELRSPLNPILGWSQLLKRGKLTAEKTAHALEIIERNAQLQVQLIGDLLDISRILRNKLEIEKVPVNLNAVVSAAIETVRLAAEAKSIQVKTVMSSCSVIGDAGRLQQVIWNLLSNAVKFTPEGGDVTIACAVISAKNSVQIKITDTGKGISAEFLPYVFEHFRQEDYSTTRKFGGLGLGLAIVRQLVDLHDGSVSVDSPGENLGATFTVQLPMANRPENAVLLSSTASALDLSGLRILTVDDEVDSQEITVFALEQAGASVISVRSGTEALEAIGQAVPDVLISDVGMPDMDGYMLMRQIRQMAPDQGGAVLAIALTAYAGESDQQQSLASGFQRHLTKPIDPDSLVMAICDLLRDGQNSSAG